MGMKLPEEYKNGVQEYLDAETDDPYAELIPLASRTTSEIKLKSETGDGDPEMAMKYGFSQPIAQVSRLTKKMYGYERDGNVKGHLAQSAVKGTNALCDLIFAAPCVNRQGRYDEEEKRARQWMRLMEPPEVKDGDEETAEAPDIEGLLRRWSAADSFMLQARVVEELQGIDAAAPLYEEYSIQKEKRDAVLMEASKLEPAANMFFWCRVRQYSIMRERAHDLALGYPTHDFGEVKTEISDGGDIHDLVFKMPWPFRESYHLVNGSMMDGEAHRTLLMAMIAGQLPQPQMPSWGMPPGYWPPGQFPGQAPEDGAEDEGGADTRKPIFGFFGKGPAAPEPPKEKPIRRRARRGRDAN